MKQSQIDNQSAVVACDIPQKHRIPVMVGNIGADIDQPVEIRDAVSRYLKDLTTAEIGRHGTFVLVATNAGASLLTEFGVPTQEMSRTSTADAAVDVVVVDLKERLGATVKLGIVSSQRKVATAKVKVTLRSLTGGRDFTAVGEGDASKGAWGVITAVNREAMIGGQGGWKLDDSMVGVACAVAVRKGIAQIGRNAVPPKED